MKNDEIEVTRKFGNVEYKLIQRKVIMRIGNTNHKGIQESWEGQAVTCTDCDRFYLVAENDDLYIIESDKEGNLVRAVCESCYKKIRKQTEVGVIEIK
jgi:hypothetical protein